MEVDTIECPKVSIFDGTSDRFASEINFVWNQGTSYTFRFTQEPLEWKIRGLFDWVRNLISYRFL